MECIESSGIARPRHGGRSGIGAIAALAALAGGDAPLAGRRRAEAKKRRYFYDVVTEQQKAEFINGEIIVHSPVKLRHAVASDRLMILLNVFVQKHGLGIVFHEKILIVLNRNDYEPDICFFGPEKAKAFTPAKASSPRLT